MTSYNISATAATASASPATPATLIRVGFGTPADNSEIVRDCVAGVKALVDSGACGRLALINGPASLPAAMVLAHGLGHVFGAIGVFDPKMAGYVISISHDPQWVVGDLIPMDQVVEG